MIPCTHIMKDGEISSWSLSTISSLKENGQKIASTENYWESPVNREKLINTVLSVSEARSTLEYKHVFEVQPFGFVLYFFVFS